MSRRTTRSKGGSAADIWPWSFSFNCEKGSLGNSSDDRNPVVKKKRETSSKMFPRVKKKNFVPFDRSNLPRQLMKIIVGYQDCFSLITAVVGVVGVVKEGTQSHRVCTLGWQPEAMNF